MRYSNNVRRTFFSSLFLLCLMPCAHAIAFEDGGEVIDLKAHSIEKSKTKTKASIKTPAVIPAPEVKEKNPTVRAEQPANKPVASKPVVNKPEVVSEAKSSASASPAIEDGEAGSDSVPSAASPKVEASPAKTSTTATDPAFFNSREPIEVVADNLTVLQNENKADFKGNVEAVQGDVHLMADEMLVYYRDNATESDGTRKAEKSAAAVGAPAASSVHRIDAVGKVFLSTPKETASGNKATYFVDKQRIELEGNVTLTQGETIIKGGFLEYDMVARKSNMLQSPKHEGAADAVTGTKQKDGRVRMLLPGSAASKPKE